MNAFLPVQYMLVRSYLYILFALKIFSSQFSFNLLVLVLDDLNYTNGVLAFFFLQVISTKVKVEVKILFNYNVVQDLRNSIIIITSSVSST